MLYEPEEEEGEFYEEDPAEKKMLIDSSRIAVCVSDIYSFRSSLEIMSCISSTAKFIFKKDGFVIEEVNESNSKAGMLVFQKRELLKYYYNPVDDYGNVLDEYVMQVCVQKLVKSMRADGKRETLQFNIYVNPSTFTSTGIVIIRTRSFEAVDTVPSETSILQPSTIYDYYTDYFLVNDIEPSGKKSAEDLVSIFKILKFKGTRVLFTKSKSGKFTVKRNDNEETIILLSDVDLVTVKQETEPVIIGGWLKINKEVQCTDMVVSINQATLEMLLKLYKVGAKNVIKIYMEENAPLTIVISIGSYGTCTIFLRSDPL